VEEEMMGWKCVWDEREQKTYRNVAGKPTGEPRQK
jgi:hypothetical protein